MIRPECARTALSLKGDRVFFLRIEDEDDGDFLSCSCDFEFFIESELFVSHIGLYFVVNLDHLVLKNFAWTIDFFEVAEAYPELVSVEGGLVTFHACVSGFQPSAIEFRFAGFGWLTDIDAAVNNIKVCHERPLLCAAIAEMSLLVGTVLTVAQGNSNFRPMKVNASRMVPTRKELTFQIGKLSA